LKDYVLDATLDAQMYVDTEITPFKFYAKTTKDWRKSNLKLCEVLHYNLAGAKEKLTEIGAS